RRTWPVIRPCTPRGPAEHELRFSAPRSSIQPPSPAVRRSSRLVRPPAKSSRSCGRSSPSRPSSSAEISWPSLGVWRRFPPAQQQRPVPSPTSFPSMLLPSGFAPPRKGSQA
ncbi:unnamed protein product, partial [Ectocarpus sp. 12 AP-2014]